MQALELEVPGPAHPAVAGAALEGTGLPAEQGDPLAAILGDVAQAAPGEVLEAEEVMRAHQLVPAQSFVGQREAHLHGRERCDADGSG